MRAGVTHEATGALSSGLSGLRGRAASAAFAHLECAALGGLSKDGIIKDQSFRLQYISRYVRSCNTPPRTGARYLYELY